MSQFSDRLTLLLEESGTNVYQISKKAKLDRTTIQRTIKGERLPSQDFVHKLCNYLRVSPIQRSELIELYTISKVGEKVYTNRKYIKEMIEQIAEMLIEQDTNYLSDRSIVLNFNKDAGITTYSSSFNIQTIVRDVLESEVINTDNPFIYLNVPFDHSFLYNILHRLYSITSKNFHIKHLLQLSKNPKVIQNANYNLTVLSNILPFAFSKVNSYLPYYYYGNIEIPKNIDIVFPYYIITNNYLIQLSSDYTNAVLITHPELYKIYLNTFDTCLLQAHPFVNQLGQCEEMITAYLTIEKKAGHITHVIEPQPCFGKYYSHDLVEKKLRKDLNQRTLIKTLVCQLYDSYRNFPKEMVSFFSVDGLEYMAQTGRIADLPPEFTVPFTVNERIFLLESLRNDIDTDNYFARLINLTKFSFSSTTTIQIYSSNAIMLINSNSKEIISSSIITENSICEAFLDFFESLKASDLLCSKQVTLKVIDEIIHKLKTGLYC